MMSITRHSLACFLLPCLLTCATASAQQAGDSPVKIFIMIGQSNMLGKGTIAPVATQGTLEYIVANDPGNHYQFLKSGGNWVVRDDVWIRDQDPVAGGLTVGFGGEAAGLIGPELGFGHHVGDLYEEQVLIVKCAWGGKSLGNDFLPPSSGPYPAPQQAGDAGFYYQEVLRLVNEATSNLGDYFEDYEASGGYEIAGICWHQGWNDRVTAAFSDDYEVNMANFIHDIRNDLGVPGLPFVIATSAMDASPDVYTQVEMAQLKMDNSSGGYADFAGNVAVVDARTTYAYDGGLTLDFWQPASASPADEGFHWNRNAKTYLHLGLAMGDAMSTLSPSRCPARLRATPGNPGGVMLSWQNGTDTPTSVRVLRGGVEIAAAAPAVPASFADPSAQPGLLEYEIQFTMPGDPCDPLTVSFSGGITGLEAFRAAGGVGLTWVNAMAYDAIEIRRDGAIIEPAFSASATSYTDTTAPSSGLVTYSVAPTNGSSTPATYQINLDAAPSGNALIYESFDYATGPLNTQSGISEVGLEGTWTATTAQIYAGSLTYGSLPTAGNSAGATGGSNNFGGARAVRASALAANNLLDDGTTLWFSVLVGYGTGGNLTNSRLGFALANNSFSTANFNYNILNSGTGSGLGLTLGRFSGSNGKVVATQFRDSDSGSGFGGNVFGTETTALFGTGVHGLIVGRIDWGAATDTITLYHPETDLVLPASPISTLSVNVDQATFDAITWARGDAVVLDEIRFGASYDDVIGAGVTNDTEPPSPNPAGFSSAPAADGDSSISMTATTGTDVSGPVEYLFTETSNSPGGTSSAWQTSPNYTDSGLESSTQYTYTVTMRDRLGNSGTASGPASATTDAPDLTAPTPNPMTWSVVPAAISDTAITMTATTATDPSGVEYFFDCLTPGGNDSGWQDEATYVDSGLEPSTSYTYEVRARDKSNNANETAASSPPATAVTDDAPSGPGGALVYEPFDYAVGGLNGQGDTSDLGFDAAWTANSTTNVVAASLTYGSLPTTGGSMGNLSGGQNRFGGSRPVDLATAGLLANGSELWFSAIMGYDSGGNRTNSTLVLVLGDEPMSGGNFAYNFTTAGATGLGVFFGRTSSNGTIKAVQVRDTTFGSSGFAGNVYGTGGGSVVVPDSNGNSNVDYRLVVGRITWGVSSDTIDLFLPGMDLALGAVHSTLTVDVDQSGFDNISFKRSDKVVMDEIRFGSSFESVIGAGAPDSPFANWSGGAPADEDSNNDGVPNGVAWALGATNPGENAIGLLPTLDNTSDPEYAIFNFHRADAANDDAGTTIHVQYGNHLAGWTTAADDGENVIIGVAEGSPRDAVEVKLKRTTLGAGGQIFVRLKVAVTP
jgi:alpha-galactosidase